MEEKIVREKAKLFLSNVEKQTELSQEEINELISELKAYNNGAFDGYKPTEIKEAIIGIPTGIKKGIYSGTYIEEKTTDGVINAIKNYMDDERTLKRKLDKFANESDPSIRESLINNSKTVRKYKRDEDYWKDIREESKKITNELFKGDPLFDPDIKFTKKEFEEALEKRFKTDPYEEVEEDNNSNKKAA